MNDDHTIIRPPLAYEGAGKDLELFGAGKELAGAGNLGAFLPGLRRISETCDQKFTNIDPKSSKSSSKRVQKETKRVQNETKGDQKGSKRVLGVSRIANPKKCENLNISLYQ